MLASVIVCTRDRAALLGGLLAALARQTLPADRFEIVVVDDHSGDDTGGTLRRWQEALPRLRPIRLERHAGLAAAGNRGVAESRGACLLFTDDDCRPAPEWAAHMVEALRHAPIAAGAILAPVGDYFQLCHNIAQFHPFLMPGPTERGCEFVAGANLGVRRSVMERVGGFDADCPVPDMEWILRARERGYAPAFAASAAVVHDPPRHGLRAVLAYAAGHAFHTIGLRQRFRKLLRTPLPLRSRTLLWLVSPLIALKTTAAIFAGNRQLWRRLHTVPVVFLAKLAWCWGAARGLAARADGR